MLKTADFCGIIIGNRPRARRPGKGNGLIMSSPIGDKRAVKIFVLYLLENINYPLELCTISDIVMQTDYVMFLDFAESFNEMTDAGLIEQLDPAEEGGNPLFIITDHGRTVAQGLKSDVLPSILDKSLTAAFRYLDFARRKITTDCEILNVNAMTGECDVHARILEEKRILFDAVLHVDSINRAERMKRNFEDKPDVIYRGYTALLAGNMNFIFDGKKE